MVKRSEKIAKGKQRGDASLCASAFRCEKYIEPWLCRRNVFPTLIVKVAALTLENEETRQTGLADSARIRKLERYIWKVEREKTGRRRTEG